MASRATQPHTSTLCVSRTHRHVRTDETAKDSDRRAADWPSSKKVNIDAVVWDL